MAARVRRFDEVDSDSDFEFEEEAPAKKTMPTLSFKTATATEETDSIAFDSDHDPSHHSEKRAAPVAIRQREAPAPAAPAPSPPAPPAKTLASALKHATSSTTAPAKSTTPAPTLIPDATPVVAAKPAAPAAMPERKKPTPSAAAPAVPAASTPIERPSHPSQPSQPTPLARPADDTTASSPAPHSYHAVQPVHALAVRSQDGDDDEGDCESDEFVQHVLPLRPRHAAAQRPPAATATAASPLLWANSSGTGATDAAPVRSAALDTATDELLVRAQLRLEERRRMNGSSRQPSPWRGAGPTAAHTPYRDGTPRQPGTHAVVVASVDPRIRRLQQENTRLQDEVAFLGRENQKLRSVQGSADASEAVRLQLTVEMLRKELESKQLGFQRGIDAAFAEKKEAQRQMEEAVVQCEGYQSAADQFKQLYSEKQREMEKVKTQLQALLYDVNAMEQHQRAMESEYADKLASEREKAERSVALAEEVKGQRDHLQFLNTQLRNEVTAAAEARRQALDQAANATDAARRDRADAEQRIEQLHRDVGQLKKALADKDRAQGVQLREAQQAQAVLQDRLKEQAEEHQREAERGRRTLEATKEDHKRLLQQERQRRGEVEERLRRMEEEGRAAQSRCAASLTAEAEARVRKLREELQAERVAREAAEREAGHLGAEAEQLREAADYYQQESQRMSSNFGQSEQLRERAERQCASLTHTLEDMMAQEEAHAREIGQLQDAVAAATQWGSGASVGRGAEADGIVSDLQQLSDENDRLTSECTRLAEERDGLIEENGRIAEELLKWKHEMRQYLTSHVRTTSPQRSRLHPASS
ncbi:hypothetical protein NESM_000733100 [Novymonas esmeraldas]|uniref:Uncharacterized protein n=1 Tax=Novymonas esmeraldas TaxID=1808958 RepID=A0AAW0EU68_9TRYP